MTTTTDERIAQTQSDRRASHTDALSEKITPSTLVIALLGIASLLVLAIVLAAVRIGYRPYRGC